MQADPLGPGAQHLPPEDSLADYGVRRTRAASRGAPSHCRGSLAAVVDAKVPDVQLVLIEGVPLHGDRTLMESLWAPADLEEVALTASSKTLATPAAAIVVGALAGRLQAALQAEGTSLAALDEASP